MLQSKAGYIDARPLTASSAKSSCNARPDHTSGSIASVWPGHGDFRSTPVNGHSQGRRARLKGARRDSCTAAIVVIAERLKRRAMLFGNGHKSSARRWKLRGMVGLSIRKRENAASAQFVPIACKSCWEGRVRTTWVEVRDDSRSTPDRPATLRPPQLAASFIRRTSFTACPVSQCTLPFRQFPELLCCMVWPERSWSTLDLASRWSIDAIKRRARCDLADAITAPTLVPPEPR